MKRVLVFIMILSALLSCKKNKIEVEENISFETNASAAVINNGNTFDLKVTLKSKLPSQGIKIEATAVEEVGGASLLQPAPITISTAIGNITLQNLPRQKWAVVTVKVSSVRTVTNMATQTFRIIYK